MAKKEKLSQEELERRQREEDRKKKEEQEQKEFQKRQKEKLEKKKRIEKRQQQRQKEEMRKVRKIVNFPFQTLFHVCTLITTLYFVVVYFGKGTEIYKSVYNSLILFTALYLGFGIVVVAIFMIMSVSKEKELLAELALMEEKKKAEEEAKLRKMKDAEIEISEDTKSKLHEQPKLPDDILNVDAENEAMNSVEPQDDIPQNENDADVMMPDEVPLEDVTTENNVK